MIDRVFFRKLMGIRSRKIAATVRKNTKVEPKPNVIDMIEPDGYLSRATQQKIIERGSVCSLFVPSSPNLLILLFPLLFDIHMSHPDGNLTDRLLLCWFSVSRWIATRCCRAP
jgi:hypothetical protein